MSRFVLKTTGDITKDLTQNDPWQHRAKTMRCFTCMFFARKHLINRRGEDTWVGRCRRNAPTIKGYPVVFEDDWCGEHKLDEQAYQEILERETQKTLHEFNEQLKTR